MIKKIEKWFQPRQPRQVRILSCNGGGIRGLLSARLLEHLMNEVGQSIQDTFHLFAGNSTGALIGLTQVRPDPHPVSALPELYHKFGPKIFYRSRGWRLRTTNGISGPKYPADGLQDCTRHVAGDCWLSDCPMDFLAPAYDLAAGRPYWFRSWAQDPSDDFALAEVGRASASAPTFFPAAEIRARDGSTRYFADGGLFANNPSLKAIECVRSLYPKAEEILLVSIGTGVLDSDLPAAEVPGWGLLSWLGPVIDILQTVNESYMLDNVAQIMKGQPYYRFDLKVSDHRPGQRLPSTAMDSVSKDNLYRLDQLAQAWIESEALGLQALISDLRKPKTSAATLGRL